MTTLNFSSNDEMMAYLKSLNLSSIDELNVYLRTLADNTRSAISQGRFADAQVEIEKVLAIVPQHVVALTDLAFVKTRQSKFDEAYQHLQQALQCSGDNIDPNTYDTIVSTCLGLHRYEEAHHYARLSMKLKKQLIKNTPVLPIPNRPVPGLSDDPKRNIISYSLFGDRPRYCEIAVMNVQLAKEIYPNWTCRYYVDDSVPAKVVQRLQNAGAEVVRVDERVRKISGLFWRFLVMDDPNVQCFIIRDADSLLSYKEKAAVDEWLASGKWFHIMRDGLEHCELILAGMWGGYPGVFPSMYDLSVQTLQEITNHTSTIDQVFLRQKLYPTVIQSAMVHDSRNLDDNVSPYPDYEVSDIERIPYFHIGMVDAGALTVSLNIEPDAKRICWQLFDEDNQQICSYENDVPSGDVFRLNLPYFYADKVQKGKYYFRHQVLERNS